MKTQTKIKTPISYYGGKQQLLKHILPLIPPHTIYIEPFFGGGALYFAKDPSPVEIINDINMNVINFYQVLKTNFSALQQKIETTLLSRATYKKALLIYETPELFADSPIIRAWAFFIATNM